MSDPFWFQAFGCVLGFDWHSSGVTTTVCGAVKESLRETGPEWGLFAAGGKGAASKKSPAQIADVCDRLGRDPDVLVHASRTAAKVDNAAVQDGYQLYHHVFLFTASGDWSVVQQGMNDQTSTAQAVSLAVGARHELRRRAARRGLLRRARRHAESGGERKRRRAARQRRAREPSARDDAARDRARPRSAAARAASAVSRRSTSTRGICRRFC